MRRPYLPSGSVPRVNYDHRARQARLRLERIERPFLKDQVRAGFRPLRLVRLRGASIAGSGREGDQGTGSSSDRRPCDITPPWLTADFRRDALAKTAVRAPSYQYASAGRY